MKILITGANGQVGMEFQTLAKQSSHSFIFTDVAKLDITDARAVMHFFDSEKPDFCVNCAAYTAVDKAEEQEAIAYKINVTGVKNLAKACRQLDIPMVQLSSDYVYDTGQNIPFKEDDETNPRSVYATTKLQGDEAVMSILPKKHIVMRTSWVYSSFGHNFVKTMIRLGTERDELGIVFDQIGTPTYARDIAAAILQIIDKTTDFQTFPKGIYHFSNEGVTSWYDFAKAIFKLKNITCHVRPIETKDYPTPAVRPPFSVLNKGKIKQVFSLEIPHWLESLEKCLFLLAGEQ